MWLLLVAAGSGYLARCWHHAEKAKHTHSENFTYAKQDEPLKRFPAPLAGNTPPNSPATRVPRRKSLPARVFGKKLCDGVAKEGLLNKKDPGSGGHQLQAANYGEIAGEDREDLADSNRLVCNEEQKERLSTLRETLPRSQNLCLHDKQLHLQVDGYNKATGASPQSLEPPTELVEESASCSQSENSAGVENPDADLQKESSSITTASSPEESHVIVHCTASDVSEILQRTTDENKFAEFSEEQEGSVSKQSKAVLERKRFSFKGASQHNTPELQLYFQFQAQRKYRRPRLRKHRRKGTMDQHSEQTGTEFGGNMGGKGRVSLTYLTGKRLGDPRKNAGLDGSDGWWAGHSVKRTKDGEEGMTGTMERHSSPFARGLVAQSDCHLKLNIAGSYGQSPRGFSQRGSYSRRLRSPDKSCKGRPVAMEVRGMRVPPKSVSALDCCLSAQLDDLDRNQERYVNRPLDFSSIVEETGQRLERTEDDTMVSGANIGIDYLDQDFNVDEQGRNRELSAACPSGAKYIARLPQNVLGRDRYLQLGPNSEKSVETSNSKDMKSLHGGESEASVINLDSLFENSKGCRKKKLPLVTRKKRKMSHMINLSSSAYRGSEVCTSEVVSRAPVEALMFSFGVGFGVMSANISHKNEVEELQQSVKEAESEVQVLRRVLQQHGLPIPDLNRLAKVGRNSTDWNFTAAVIEGAEEDHTSDKYASLRFSVTEGASPLQGDQMADLEAELAAELEHLTGQFTDLDELELDGVAAVVHGDLNVRGLPAQVDSDGDDNSAPEVACMNNYAVSPRELTRLLRKLQATRQEERIAEMEMDLETVRSQLLTREKELNLWKDRVRRLTELSVSSPAHGEDRAFLGTPSSGSITPCERSSPTSDSEADPKTEVHVGTSFDRQESFRFPLPSAASAGKGLEKSCSKSRQKGEEDPIDSAGQSTLGNVEPRLTRDTSFRIPSRELSTQEDRPMVDSRLNFGDMRNNPWVTNDVRDEFLRSMDDSSADILLKHEQTMQSTTDCKPIFEDSQIEQLILNSVKVLGSLEVAESSVMGSNTPNVLDYASAISMSDGWDNGPESSTGEQFRTGCFPQRAREKSGRAKAVSYIRPTESATSISELSDGEEYRRSGTRPPPKYLESSSVTPAPGDQSMIPFFWNRDGGGLGRAGANTPIDSRFISNQSTTSAQITLNQQKPLIMDQQRIGLNPTVYDKIVGWEGLIRRVPPPVVSSDWECYSRASESDQQDGPGAHLVEGDPFCEESLASEAEEYLGNMLINKIVERTRRGSDIVREAQTKLATLDTDTDSGESLSDPLERNFRKVRSKDGKAAEEEYELLRKGLPKRFEVVRVSDDGDYERAVFPKRMDAEESLPEFDQGSVSEEGSLSKFGAREKHGRFTADTAEGVGGWSRHGDSHQDSPFRSRSRVEESQSRRRL